MKQAADTLTPELPGIPAQKKRGRPASGKAMTAAERMRRYREGLKAAGPNESMMLNALNHLFKSLERAKDAEAYYRIKGATLALNWANLISDDEKDRADEWAYCVWQHNNFKR